MTRSNLFLDVSVWVTAYTALSARISRFVPIHSGERYRTNGPLVSQVHNSRNGGNSDKKKKKTWVSYFSMRNPYMKFQNPSMHSSKDMACIKKHD